MTVIGIDPGITGGLAMLDAQRKLIACAYMPVMVTKTGKTRINPAGLTDLLEAWTVGGTTRPLIALELVNAMPSVPDKKTGQRRQLGATSGFSLGRSLGTIEGVIAALRMPVEEVSPRSWKQFYGLKGPDKEQSRAAAIKLYPGAALALKKDHAKAEAILIARYVLRETPERPF